MMKQDGMPAPCAGRTWRRAATRFAALALLLTPAACSDDDPAGPQEPEQTQVASVAVAPTPVDLAVGETRQLTATPKAADGTPLSRTVTWRSADTSVVTVSAGGLVAARKAGQTQVIATSEGKEGAATVRVAAPPPPAGEIELSAARVDVQDIMWGANPAPKQVAVTGKNGEVSGLAVEVVYGQAGFEGWLVASINATTTLAALTLQARTGILTPGTYTATVRVRSSQPGIAAESLLVAFEVAPAPGVLWVSAADRHNCALTGKGEVFCWGYNNMKQLGSGSDTEFLTTPTALAGGRPFGLMNAGELHNCAVAPGAFPGGAAFCWGSGMMGDGTQRNGVLPTEVPARTWSTVAPGYRHTCALTPAGEAYCWGVNHNGQVGDGTRTNRFDPTSVAGGHTFTALTAGRDHTCGLTAAGDVYCWGSGSYGSLGSGDTSDATTPVKVAGGISFKAIEAGEHHTCGIAHDGAAYCWGYNLYAQLGDGSQVNKLVPTPVAGGLTFSSLSAGAVHTCGITTAGQAYCWGYRAVGRLGGGNTAGYALAPEPVASASTFRVITAGYSHTCAITTGNNELYCWGFNEAGAVGDGTVVNRPTPVRVQVQ